MFELAVDRATPGRASVVALVVNIGRESLERAYDDDGTEIDHYLPTGCAQTAAFLRARGMEFAELARDSDRNVRLAATSGWGRSLTMPARPPPC
ncbi:hypothetical protein [Streptomyces sp. NPDC006668]|uniref:hypothetical protein n=1 Tax=Streptomyces sp. NPDC006668 TaxID=3156903 RepID=UPI0033FFC4CD